MSSSSDIASLRKKIAALEKENRMLKKELDKISRGNKMVNTPVVAQSESLEEKALTTEEHILGETVQSDVYERAILDHTGHINALIDTSYAILFANKKAQEKIQLIRKSDFQPGLSALPLIPARALNTFKKSFQSVLKGETRVGIIKYKFIGDWQWFKYRFAPAYNTEGKVLAVAFSAMEISDLKQKEENLKAALKSEHKLIAGIQANERFLNSIIDNLPIGFQLYDKNGYSIRMNEKQQELLGIKNVQYAVGEFNILTDPIMKESGISQVFISAYRGETTSNFETEVNFGNPENKWETHRFKKYYNIKVCPIFDAHHQVTAVACLTQDVTDRKLVLKELLKSKNALEEAQEFGKLGTWRMDLKTQTLTWSKQVFESFGLDAEAKEPTYKEYQQMLHPEDWEKLAGKVTDTLENGSNYEIELRHRLPDGTYQWWYTKGKPLIDDEGKIVGISGINIDINSRKQAEIKMKESMEQLQILNTELQKANRELDRFVYSASHDLRAPIASVLGLIELCKMTTDANELKDYFHKQEISIQKLDHFIRDILDYSRNARMELQKDPIEFQTFINDIFEQYDYQAHSENIQKIFKINQKSAFFTDQRRLNVIFNNLISNAIRYSDLRKSQSYIEVQVNCTTKEARISISDNGQGISKEHVDKVFEMFYRGRESGSGSGLGLYIVKETIDKLCGKVDLTSELGKGTTIILKIPNTPPNA